MGEGESTTSGKITDDLKIELQKVHKEILSSKDDYKDISNVSMKDVSRKMEQELKQRLIHI